MITDIKPARSGVGVVVLAAGAASRMRAGAKQLLLYENETLLRRAVEAALASRAEWVVVVLGAHYAETLAAIEDSSALVAHNDDWRSGLASSIVCGLNRLLADGENPRAALVTLADQPLVTAEKINLLIETFNETGAPLVAARYAETVGVPALFARQLFAELLEIKGDKGAKDLIVKHLAVAEIVPMPEAATDIDTPEDYQLIIDK